jgi:hypothetical protein
LIIVVLFPFVKLLAIYLFTGSLPTVYYSFTPLILPSQFSFSMFRKAFLDAYLDLLSIDNIRNVGPTPRTGVYRI